MAKMEGIESLVGKLTAKERQLVGDPNLPQARISYNTDYALRVHEDREVFHFVGRAGYLLDVAREERQTAAAITVDAMRRGLSLGWAARMGGNHIFRVSQENVPVDTGKLKRSGRMEMVREDE